jgi:hypothetical protein
MARLKPPLLEAMAETPPVGRQDYLLTVFGRRIDLTYRKKPVVYVPVERIDGALIGRVGRPAIDHPAGPPESGFAPTEVPIHIAVNLFLDTAGDPDGQKLALQANPRVGSPRHIVEAIVQHINDQDADAPWQIDVHPITDSESFWNAVKRHDAEITSLQLTFSATNVLGIFDNVTGEVDAAKKENNAASMTVSLDNGDGIKVDTPSIRKAINYISQGGGFAIIRKGRKKLFDTTETQRSVSVEGDAPASPGKIDTLGAIKRALFGR